MVGMRIRGVTSRLVGLAMAVGCLAGCGSGPAATIAPPLTSNPSASDEPTLVASSPAESLSPSASIVPTPSAIRPGSVPSGPPLHLAWKGVDPSVADPPVVGVVAIASDGHIWASATKLNRFWIFDRNGRFLESWGREGADDGQFDFARDTGDSFGAVAFAPDGTLYVADTGNRRIQHFDRERQFVESWGQFGDGDGEFVSPEAIAIDGAAHVYVMDGVRHDVQEFGPTGEFVRSFGDGDGPLVATLGQDHVLLVNGAEGRLEEFAAGAVVRTIDLHGLATSATGIAGDQDGNIWLATQLDGGMPKPGDLLQFSPAGQLLHRWPVPVDSFALDAAAERVYTNFFPETFLAAYDLPNG